MARHRDDPSLKGAGLRYLDAQELVAKDRWTTILGDATKNVPPADPFMRESTAPRTGANAITDDPIVAETSGGGGPGLESSTASTKEHPGAVEPDAGLTFSELWILSPLEVEGRINTIQCSACSRNAPHGIGEVSHLQLAKPPTLTATAMSSQLSCSTLR